jgi:diguanylate cyclase (GGDEF)-like protein/PAS domain S-box-containing protein
MNNTELLNLPQAVIDVLPLGIAQCGLVLDDNSNIKDIRILKANKSIREITGYNNYELANKTMKELFPAIRESVYDWIKILGEASLYIGTKHIEQYMDVFDKYLSVDVVSIKENGFYLVMEDITDKKECSRNILEKVTEINYINEELRKKANLDNMTLAYNYQFIMKLLKEEVETANKESKKFTVALLDIDRFTEINRNHGIEVGDKVLEETSEALKNSMRKIDSLARTGGDEFLLLLTNVDINIAKIVIERMKTQLNLDVRILKGESITLSGAVLEYEDGGCEDFYHELRAKLDKAKSLGYNTIIF